MGRQARRHPVLDQHPAAVVPQVGRRAGRARSREHAGDVGPTDHCRPRKVHQQDRRRGRASATRATRCGSTPSARAPVSQVVEQSATAARYQAGPRSPAGEEAAEIIGELANAGISPSLSTEDEEVARAPCSRAPTAASWSTGLRLEGGEQRRRGGSLAQSAVYDIGWAQYPQTIEVFEGKPPPRAASSSARRLHAARRPRPRRRQVHHEPRERDLLHDLERQPSAKSASFD